MRVICFLFLITLCACDGGFSRSDLRNELQRNKEAFETTTKDFLKQKNIEWISIHSEYETGLCQSINRWSNCPSTSNKWEDWDDSLKITLYLNSVDEVLKATKIQPDQYKFFYDFMKSHNLRQISRVFACGDCVEFESRLNGLRYVSNKENVLSEDHEYLEVERINDHWFVYSKDWN